LRGKGVGRITRKGVELGGGREKLFLLARRRKEEKVKKAGHNGRTVKA